MKTWIVCASALALASACGSSKEATAALDAMNLTDGTSGLVKYASKSGSGDKVTLKDVVIGPGAGQGFKAKSLVLDGLGLTSDGKPMFRDLTLKDVSPEAETPGVTFNLATVSIRNPNEITAAFLASSLTQAGPATPPPFEQWSLDKISFNGLTITGDLAQMGMGAGSFSVAMDEMSVASLKDTIFGSAILSGLKGTFDVPAEAGAGFPVAGTFDFGKGEIKGLRGGLYATAFEAGFASGMDPMAMQTINADMIAAMTSPIDPGFDTFNWSGMNIAASGVKLATSAIDQKATRNAQGVVTAVSSPRATVSFTANAADGQLGAMAGGALGMIGYETVELYGEGDATFDPATDTTRYTRYNFGMTDGFDIVMSGGFLGVQKALVSLMSGISSMGGAPIVEPDFDDETPDADAPVVEPTLPAAPDFSGVGELTIVDLDLTLTDKSLVNRLLQLSTMMGSPDPEALRTDIVNQIAALGADLSAAGVDPAVSSELLAAVSSFIKQPGTLSIKLKPATPLKLGDVSGPEQLTKTTLGFSATSAPAN
ncbi:MAG: hypothetical protein SGJ21_10880 [Alphaproteobacteria bacterium]|nr:hypothetical protein [Alphaproteobacteria bacterium]